MARDCTIDDIARELGVSKTTVSRAISGKGRISEATRGSILALIEERGYRPNAVAKGLAQSRTYNIGVIIPTVDVSREFQFFRECLLGICSAASGRDYDVIVTVGGERGQIHRILENGKVDGVIAARGETGSAAARFIRDHGTPFVTIGPTDMPEHICVDNANELASAEMTRLLIHSGAKRLAVFGGSRRHLVTDSRSRGFLEACAGDGVEDGLVFLDLVSEEDVGRAIDSALASGTEAIVCMDDALCLLAMQGLARRGVEVPERVKVACLYDSVIMSGLSPSVTAVRFDGVKLGEMACFKLLELIETGRADSAVLPEFQIIRRESA